MALLSLAGFAHVAAQRSGWVSLETSTAICVVLVSLMLSLWLRQHDKTVTALEGERARAERGLEDGWEQRRTLVKKMRRQGARLEAILSSAKQFAIIATDPAGRINHFSRGATAMLGYSAQEVRRQDICALLYDPKELLRRGKAMGLGPDFDVVRAVPSLKASEERDWTWRAKDGRRIAVLVSTTQIDPRPGQAAGYVLIARDVSQERAAQRERDAFLGLGHELLCITDPRGVLLRVSPSFSKVMGYAPDDLLGRPFFDFVHPEDYGISVQAAKDADSGLVLERFENRWRTKDGRYRWVSWDCSAPFGDGLAYSTGWDVTENKLRGQRRQEELAFEQQLIGITSHDLRNPITAISLAAQRLAHAPDNPERVASVAARIEHACARADRLIHDILDFTQARLGGGIKVVPREVNVRRLLEEVVEDIRAVFPTRAVCLEAPPELLGLLDHNRLQQLLGNLLTNACKYSPADAPVSVVARAKRSQLVITVHNGGEPIAPAMLPVLFEPMRRGKDSPGADQRSVGLGLYIVREITKAHHGQIGVTSTAEDGTTFCVCLPHQAGAGSGADGAGHLETAKLDAPCCSVMLS